MNKSIKSFYDYNPVTINQNGREYRIRSCVFETKEQAQEKETELHEYYKEHYFYCILYTIVVKGKDCDGVNCWLIYQRIERR